MEFDSIVCNGEIWVDGTLSRVDVGIAGGRIAALGHGLGSAPQVIDAGGQLVLPGGIDVHTHFHTEVGGAATADDYESGTRAAAFGGITTVLNYAFQDKGEQLSSVIRRERLKAAGQAYIDYGFHVVVLDAGAPDLAAQLTELPGLGCPSIKVFTAMDFRLSDAELLTVLDHLRGSGVLVNVHAEDGALVDYLTARLLGEGRTGIDQLGASRPPMAEALAVQKMVSYAAAAGCPLYIVHLSSKAAMDVVRRGRQDGAEVYVETRPAYLYLDESAYSRTDGNRYACWPPLRNTVDQQELWSAVVSGEVQCYATDHTTWTLAQKMDPSLPFPAVPGGMPNVQTSIGMLFSEGVRTGRLSLGRFVELTAETPARLFGLWPRKAAIAEGSDADLMLIDPALQYRVVSDRMQSAADFDPHEGYVSDGWPAVTISRGQVVMRDQRLTGTPEHGQFLARAPFRSLAGS